MNRSLRLQIDPPPKAKLVPCLYRSGHLFPSDEGHMVFMCGKGGDIVWTCNYHEELPEKVRAKVGPRQAVLIAHHMLHRCRARHEVTKSYRLVNLCVP